MSKKKQPPQTSPLTLGMPPGGADVHAHLDKDHFGNDFDAVIDLAQRCGVSYIGNVFLEPDIFWEERERFTGRPGIFFLLGIHPCDGQKCTPEALERIEEAFKRDSRIRAAGEIGLDYYWDDCPPEIQKAAFVAQLKLARKYEKPICVHCRDAVDDTLAILEGQGFKGYKVQWHCFGGDKSLAERIINNGWHISVPGPVGYPANNDLREAVKYIPLERMMIETDCPYLAPLEWRGKRNEPAFSVFTAARIAEERGMDAAELWVTCGATAKAFFAL